MGRMKTKLGMVGCEVCGNHCSDYFEVLLGGKRHVFDCFECAIQAFMPHCQYCGCQIQGHGVALGDDIFCSDPCANEKHRREIETRVQVDQRVGFPSASLL